MNTFTEKENVFLYFVCLCIYDICYLQYVNIVIRNESDKNKIKKTMKNGTTLE